MTIARPFTTAVVFATLLVAVARAAGDDRPLWIAVVAEGHREAAEPLIQRRRRNMEVVVVDPADHLTPEQIRDGAAGPLVETVRARLRGRSGPRFVVLIGAATSDGIGNPRRFVAPACRDNVGRMSGAPSDNAYGCLDGGRLPEVAVGRFPARTAEQTRAMVEKTLAWEKGRLQGAWKRRFTLILGPPAFGPLVDRALEAATLTQMARVPAEWTGRAIYRSEHSAFGLPDDLLRSQTVDYLSEGQALTFYLGHSLADGFWFRRTLDAQRRWKWSPIMSRGDWDKLRIPSGGGLFITTGCLGAQLADGEGYGVHAMRNRHGPVAVIGSHGNCWESMVYLFALGILESLPAGVESVRIADLWLAAKRNLATGTINPILYHMLNNADGKPDDRPLKIQRDEHLDMFQLLGDPAVRLPSMTHTLDITVSGEARPGGSITLSAPVPAGLKGAAARVTLERPLTSRSPDLEILPKDPARRRAVRIANHERANDFVLFEANARLEDATFKIRIAIPNELPAQKLVVRLHAAKGRFDAMAVCMVAVAAKRTDP